MARRCGQLADLSFAAFHLVRELAPAELLGDPTEIVALSETWSDYDGDDIYGDYTVEPGTNNVMEVAGYDSGIGLLEGEANR